MMIDAWTAALILMSYLTGGIPTGYLVVRRFQGLDIRDHGSGNPGTANVYRVAGTRAGLITLVGDALKGYLPVFLALKLYPGQLWVPIFCGAAAVIGHNWTVFLGFRGGKGVATSAGVFAALIPKSLVCAVIIFAAGIGVSGHISVGSMAGAVALPFFTLIFPTAMPLTVMALCSGVLILIRHIPNIKKLFFKKELSLYEKKY